MWAGSVFKFDKGFTNLSITLIGYCCEKQLDEIQLLNGLHFVLMTLYTYIIPAISFMSNNE